MTNEAGPWDEAPAKLEDWDPRWAADTEAMSAKLVEFISIAFDASFTHMYAPGTRGHIRNALKAGASVGEVFEVLKICVAQGMQACNLGVPILEEELERQRGAR